MKNLLGNLLVTTVVTFLMVATTVTAQHIREDSFEIIGTLGADVVLIQRGGINLRCTVTPRSGAAVIEDCLPLWDEDGHVALSAQVGVLAFSLKEKLSDMTNEEMDDLLFGILKSLGCQITENMVNSNIIVAISEATGLTLPAEVNVRNRLLLDIAMDAMSDSFNRLEASDLFKASLDRSSIELSDCP